MRPPSLFENQRINIMFIVIVSMLVYLNALFAGVSSLDDSGLFQALHRGDIKTSDLFLSGGTYFRPLTILSYLTDNAVWSANPAAFHFTNMLLHTANALLVYALTLTYLDHGTNTRHVALIAALLFAAHPANSESVTWISGRTDLLCALFFLLTLIILVRTDEDILPSCFMLFIAFTCSLFAKESSISLLAIAPVCLFSTRKQRWNLRSTSLCATLVTTALLYTAIRSGSTGQFDKGVSAISTTLVQHDVLKRVYDTLAIMGFYFKKMVWPFPLNIAIHSFDKPLYLFIGCGTLAALIVFFLKQKEARLPLSIILFGLAPPLLVYHTAIPWMPIAERYLYIPLIGTVLLVAVMIRHVSAHCHPLCFMVILATAVATTFRVGLWADPVALWADTVAKSQSAPAARVIYAHELQKSGRFADAAKQLDMVSSVHYEDFLYWRCKARQSLVNNNMNGYESNMIKAAQLTSTPSLIYNEIAVTLSQKSNHPAQQLLFLSKAISYYEKAWELDHREIAGLYRAARLSLRIGDEEGCRQLLKTYLSTTEKKQHAEQARALLDKLTIMRQSLDRTRQHG